MYGRNDAICHGMEVVTRQTITREMVYFIESADSCWKLRSTALTCVAMWDISICMCIKPVPPT